MYVPKMFEETRPEVLRAAIRESRLSTLVTLGADGLIATHLPMQLDEREGPHGTLYGHVARANPQWRTPANGVQALAIFTGPEAYVTPSWYASKREHGRVVPTWNYVAVHAYGEARFFDDPAELLALVTRLTEHHERPREKPWAVSDAPEDFVASQLKGIVGVVLPIARIEGKWKMSQNRPARDRAGVIEGLGAEGREDVASLVPRVDASDTPA